MHFLKEAKERNIAGKEITPFLLGKIKDITGGASLEDMHYIRGTAYCSKNLPELPEEEIVEESENIFTVDGIAYIEEVNELVGDIIPEGDYDVLIGMFEKETTIKLAIKQETMQGNYYKIAHTYVRRV